MKIHRYLIGAIVGLVGALVFSSVASADVTALDISASNVTPAKQDKKVRGAAATFFQSTDTHAGALPCTGTGGSPPANSLLCSAFPPSIQSVITFPTDYKFNPGKLPDCNLASLVGKSTAAARASCPGSVVGGGTNIQRFSDGRIINGVITAFNGAPSGGNPSLYLHVEFPQVETKPILNGVIRGNVLTVQIPPVQGSVIDQFNTSLNRIVTQKKKNKKTGKVVKTFYFAAKCSKRTWTTREDVTYQAGRTLSAQTTQKCTQKKKKK